MLVNVDYRKRPHQAIGWNLVHGPCPGSEMCRSVQVRTVVLLGGEDAGVISVALDVAEFRGLKRRLFRPFPIGRAVVQSMREVDNGAKFHWIG